MVDVLGSDNVSPTLIIDRVTTDYAIQELRKSANQRLQEQAAREKQIEQVRVDQMLLMTHPTLVIAKRLANFSAMKSQRGAGASSEILSFW